MLMLSTLHLTLLLTLMTDKVKGGWLQQSNVHNGEWDGYLCVDTPPWDAQCGWQLVVTSNPVLSSIQAYAGVVTKLNGGALFYIANALWNEAEPSTTQAQFCTQVKIHGSFGSTMPSYVTVDWYCICRVSTCEPVGGVASATVAVTSTTLTSTTPVAPPTSTALTITGQMLTGRYLKHTGRCHASPASTDQVTYHMRCFRMCLRLNDCTGLNVIPSSAGFACHYVTGTIDPSDLVASGSSSCQFWERQ